MCRHAYQCVPIAHPVFLGQVSTDYHITQIYRCDYK